MFNKIDKPQLMGILNITPDSFSDGGKFISVDPALDHVRKMIKEGVDIIDVGGESTRPGSKSVAITEQINRVVPIIEAIRNQVSDEIPISIDTTHFNVVEAALAAGANIINDISAGLNDPKMFEWNCCSTFLFKKYTRNLNPSGYYSFIINRRISHDVLDGFQHQHPNLARTRASDRPGCR